MHLDELKSHLSSSLNPSIKSNGKYRLASILVVIYGDEPIVIMTEKPKHMTFHAGEISFPGGKLDSNDSNLLETALRETSEEIGLTIAPSQVIGQLEPVITLNSGFMILPFVSVVKEIPTLSANAEVEKIFRIPLESFLKTQAKDPDPSHNLIQEMYTFEYENQIVWGASARILKQIRDCLKS
ncbi:coenzyme A pyrophosphatase [Nitrosopumilus cobalaminigenes]|uniref:Coenzyme A pyrophosphatase n=1 Tax=Nitrosopumilus cobalaminigenes TaxID=1470066 RepID=A0A7D5M451_9ARCH|nr:CoA pyrophosphatase [Nitrosopumilus cobalaminigenes]QLH03289.1 coenzyme A pyrophosphatase [Nitrosopumilus cobalaminigenes]